MVRAGLLADAADVELEAVGHRENDAELVGIGRDDGIAAQEQGDHGLNVKGGAWHGQSLPQSAGLRRASCESAKGRQIRLTESFSCGIRLRHSRCINTEEAVDDLDNRSCYRNRCRGGIRNALPSASRLVDRPLDHARIGPAIARGPVSRFS